MKIDGKTIKLSPGEIITIESEEQAVEQPIEQPIVDNSDILYKVGLIADIHFDIEDSHNSEYKEDLQNAIAYYKKNNVDFIASTGDFCQYNSEDLNEFYNCYKSNNNLPLFTCMGNHDHWCIYRTPNNEELWKNTITALQGNDIHYFGNTTKQKTNYQFEKNGDIWVFISIDYGTSKGEVWDEAMRGLNLLNKDDWYVKQMMNYVKDTKYDESKEKNFDYQFYDPAILIQLKNLIKSNKNKRIFVYMHHFMPNKAGDTFTNYSHLRIWPYPTSTAIKKKYYSGSNTICGLTFWFLNKLMNEHLNAIYFGGHSHYSWKQQEDVITRNYDVKQPTGKEVTPLVDDLNSLNGTQYDYGLYTTIGHSICNCATTVHLPSLTKPTLRYNESQYGGSEGGILEIYKDYIILKQIIFKKDGSSTYINEEIGQKKIDIKYNNETTQQIEPVTTETLKDRIKFNITNQTNKTVYFSGKLNLYIRENITDTWDKIDKVFPAYLCAPDDTSDGRCHWRNNSYSLTPGQSIELILDTSREYVGTGKANDFNIVSKSLDTYAGKYFVDNDKDGTWPRISIPAIKLGVAVEEDGTISNTAFVVHVKPIPKELCKIEKGKTYDLIIDGVKDNYKLNSNNRYTK